MNGVWRTVGGRRIFIKDGEDLASAMKRSGKFNSKKGLTNAGKEKLKELEKDEKFQKEFNEFLEKSIEREKPEGAKFVDMLERHNVRTFADDIELKEMSKMTNKELIEFEKSKGSFKTADNAEFARVKELYYETGLAKYKEKMDEILRKHNIR